MWTTVLVLAIAVIFEPVRIGLAVLMLNRPRPMLHLLTFLCGGFTMGVGVGLVVLFILRPTLPAAGRFTVAEVQIVVGLLALLVTSVLTMNISACQFARRPFAGATVRSDSDGVAIQPTQPSVLERLSIRARPRGCRQERACHRERAGHSGPRHTDGRGHRGHDHTGH
jgi:Sap, sulfolipid-1-addressing protein